MPRPDFLAIGHVTKDIQEEGYTIGGAVTYSSLTARSLRVRTAVVTRTSPDLDLGLFRGIEVLRLPSAATTTFQNLYRGEVREQFIRAIADKIEAEDIPSEWKDAKIVYLAPLAGELDENMVHLFPHALVGVSPQGWMRCWNGNGRVLPKIWEEADKVLPRAEVVIFSDEDVDGDEELIRNYARMANILVVTRGSRGATVYHRGEVRHFPAFETVEVDPTGAGDVFAAAYLIELERSSDPYRAARFANCVASFAVERPGTKGIPTPEQVEQRLTAGKTRFYNVGSSKDMNSPSARRRRGRP